MTQNQPTKVLSVANIGEPISHELTFKMGKDYNDLHNNETPTSFVIGRELLERVLAQPDCQGIKIYPGLNEQGRPTLIYLGVDSKLETILKYSVVGDDGSLKQVEALSIDRSKDTSGTSSDSSTWNWSI